MIAVSASAFDILWTDLGHTGPPEPLLVRSVGRTHEERAAIKRSVYRNLTDRGLIAGGRVDPALRARLDTLATATVRVECEALTDIADTIMEPFRAVAASRGTQAVLATQPEQTIALSTVHAGSMVSAIVEVLPKLRPGPGYGVSLPAAELGGRVEDPVFEPPGSGRTGSYGRQIREVLAIRARPVYSAGQFSVQTRDGQGKLRRAGGLSWFVTDVGAYFGTVSWSGDGQQWVNLTPADHPRLVAKLVSIIGQD